MRAACVEGLGHLGEMSRWDPIASTKLLSNMEQEHTKTDELDGILGKLCDCDATPPVLQRQR